MSKHGKANLTTWGYCSAGALGVLAPLCTVELGLLRLHGPGMLMVAGCWVIGGLALPEQLGVIKSKWCPLFVMSCLHLGWLLPAAQAVVEKYAKVVIIGTVRNQCNVWMGRMSSR